MNILNIDNLIKEANNQEKKLVCENHPLYPQGFFRWLVIGSSGSGKTNLILDAIIQSKIDFDHLYLFVRDPHQDKYQFLIRWFTELETQYQEENNEAVSMVTVISDPNDFIDVDDFDSSMKNLVLFDDLVLEKDQHRMITFFLRGRHRSISSIYLTQSYFSTPKNIRINCDFFTIFGVPSQNELIQLTKEHSMGMDNTMFKKLFHEATKEKYSFMVIDRQTDDERKQIRKGFDQGFF